MPHPFAEGADHLDTAPEESSSSNPEAAPVAGEAVTVDAVIPSADQLHADARGRIGNTAVQVGIPAAIVGIASWAARLAELDLDPGAGVDLPMDVTGYFIAVLTVAFSYAMNRRNLR